MKYSLTHPKLILSALAFQALLLSGTQDSHAHQRRPANDDALVDITTNRTIKIGANIIIFGDGATRAKAKEIQSNILKSWATQFSLICARW
jgi:hypothetical protein